MRRLFTSLGIHLSHTSSGFCEWSYHIGATPERFEGTSESVSTDIVGHGALANLLVYADGPSRRRVVAGCRRCGNTMRAERIAASGYQFVLFILLWPSRAFWP